MDTPPVDIRQVPSAYRLGILCEDSNSKKVFLTALSRSTDESSVLMQLREMAESDMGTVKEAAKRLAVLLGSLFASWEIETMHIRFSDIVEYLETPGMCAEHGREVLASKVGASVDAVSDIIASLAE